MRKLLLTLTLIFLCMISMYKLFAQANYCYPRVPFPCQRAWVSNVTLATINNNSGCSASGYTDYSNSLSTTLTAGSKYTISMSSGGNMHSQYASVYIDWNKDGDFFDDNELVSQYIWLFYNGDPGTASFTVPMNASGSYRIRIITDNWPFYSPNPCFSTYGEAEDYTINVPVSCAPPVISCPSNINVNNAPGVCGAQVTFQASATGTSPDITYSVQPGSTFPVGSTKVVVTASNDCGSSTCSFIVNVADTEAPSISCPANQYVQCASQMPALKPDQEQELLKHTARSQVEDM